MAADLSSVMAHAFYRTHTLNLMGLDISIDKRRVQARRRDPTASRDNIINICLNDTVLWDDAVEPGRSFPTFRRNVGKKITRPHIPGDSALHSCRGDCFIQRRCNCIYVPNGNITNFQNTLYIKAGCNLMGAMGNMIIVL